jgi:hypothetical protein
MSRRRRGRRRGRRNSGRGIRVELGPVLIVGVAAEEVVLEPRTSKNVFADVVFFVAVLSRTYLRINTTINPTCLRATPNVGLCK